MIRQTFVKACIATALLSAPSALAAEYTVDVVDVFDRACIPFSIEDRHPAESGLRNLAADERASTIYEGEAYDDLIWIDPATPSAAFFIVPNEGCGVSGWVSGPSVIVEEVAILASRLDAVPTKYEFQEASVIQEQGYGVGRFCVDAEDGRQAVFIHARIGQEGDRWGATLSTSETAACGTNELRGN